MEPSMLVVSWNVDGYRDIVHSKMTDLINKYNPDLLFLNETKKSKDYLESKFSEFTNYNYLINCNAPSRYHGVVVLIKKTIEFKEIVPNLGVECRRDTNANDPSCGRIVAININNKYNIVGVYVPNSGISTKDRDYKLNYRINKWDPAFRNFMNDLKSQNPTILIGDINVAPTDLDVSNPKRMELCPGFLPQEKLSFTKFLSGGWCDIWRYQNPDVRKYSWVSHSPRKNFGMRLDNIIVSDSIVDKCYNPFIDETFTFSDHLPIGVSVCLF